MGSPGPSPLGVYPVLHPNIHPPLNYGTLSEVEGGYVRVVCLGTQSFLKIAVFNNHPSLRDSLRITTIQQQRIPKQHFVVNWAPHSQCKRL